MNVNKLFLNSIDINKTNTTIVFNVPYCVYPSLIFSCLWTIFVMLELSYRNNLVITMRWCVATNIFSWALFIFFEMALSFLISVCIEYPHRSSIYFFINSVSSTLFIFYCNMIVCRVWDFWFHLIIKIIIVLINYCGTITYLAWSRDL